MGCELTGKPAVVSLITPLVTLHFVSKDIAVQAWDGILCKIAHVLGTLLAPQPLVGSEEERSRRFTTVQSTKVGLIALCNEEASRHVVQGRYELQYLQPSTRSNSAPHYLVRARYNSCRLTCI